MLNWLRAWRWQHGAQFSKDTPLESLRYVVFDTEFSSLNHRDNRLLSIGAVAMEGSKIKLGEQFYRVVNPGEPVPAQSVLIHQLRSEDVEAGEPFARVQEDLRQFLNGAVLVGHFVHMDLKILHKELGVGDRLTNPTVDTARVYRWLLRHGRYSEELATQLDRVDLGALARAYGLEVHDAHHALHDAFLTARVWQRMLPALEQMSVRSLGKLLRIAGV
jgi:DNA polymerase III epsilon subunit family exonuclease